MTLIEVLITIVVFTSGILVILWVITSSLSLGSRSRNRTIATMLAKEWLEMVYNIRDTNLDKAQSWWCVSIWGVICNYQMSWSNTYYLTIDSTWSNVNIINVREMNTSKALITPRLYSFTGWWIVTYNHVSSWTPSPFYRYIIIEPVKPIAGNATDDFTNSQIKKITSIVEYSQLWWTWKVELESFIGLTR